MYGFWLSLCCSQTFISHYVVPEQLSPIFDHRMYLAFIEYMYYKWQRICSTCRNHFPDRSSCMIYHWVCNYIKTLDATSGAGTAYPFEAPDFIPGMRWGSCYSIFSFMCMFCRSLCICVLFGITLSVLLRFTDFDYPIGIFKHFLQRKLIILHWVMMVHASKNKQYSKHIV